MIWHILPRKDEGEADVRGQEMICNILSKAFHVDTLRLLAKKPQDGYKTGKCVKTPCSNAISH